MEPTLSEEQKRMFRQMLESEPWRIALGLLETLSIRKEREKAENLRVNSPQGDRNSVRLQGVIDGIDYAIDTIESAALNPKAEEEGPLY